MINNVTITIGIPTYKRRDSVIQRVKDLLSYNIQDSIKILVIDNASPDGTFEGLSQFGTLKNLSILKNERNLGFAGSFLRMLKCCDTQYLIVVSDEDEILKINLPAYIDFLDKKSPDFVSPKALMNAEVYRGRAKTGLINLDDFESAGFYLSGLTYKIQKCSEGIKFIEKNRVNNSAAEMYPQIVMALFIIAKERQCYWWDGIITSSCEQLESHCFDIGGIPYYHLQGRWLQYKGFIDCFTELIEQASNEKIKKMLQKSLISYEASLYNRLRSAIEMERPKSVAMLDFGAREIHIVNRIFKIILMMIIDPLQTIKKIIRKLTAS
jgi:glycosyltransferase involved in cell wall biosynthesis